jgi:hypothetical protein
LFNAVLSYGANTMYRGEGLVNEIINRLPIELHLPGGYQFCGPGTKLSERLQRGQKGINALDAACREHDIAYSLHRNDINKRHEADRVLEEKAWQRVKSNDASLGEKSAAWLVTNAMKAKRKLGMGIRRHNKRKHKRTKRGRGISRKKTKTGRKVSFNAHILRQVKDAIRKSGGGAKDDLKRGAGVALTAAKKFLRRAGGKKRVKLPRVIPVPKSGGFLPLLPAIFAGLSALGGLAGGTAGIVKAVNDAKAAKQKLQEDERHNRAMEAIAVGKPGSGLYLKPYKKGYGIYFKPKKN